MEWRDVPDYESLYQVNEFGQVRNASGHVMSPAFNRFNGYLFLLLTKTGKRRMHYLHRLVAAAFLGPCPWGMEVAHKNEVKTDPRAENLMYVTHKQNAKQWFARTTVSRRPDGTFSKFH